MGKANSAEVQALWGRPTGQPYQSHNSAGYHVASNASRSAAAANNTPGITEDLKIVMVRNVEEIRDNYMSQLERAFIRKDVYAIKDLLRTKFLSNGDGFGVRRYRIAHQDGALVIIEYVKLMVGEGIVSLNHPQVLEEYRKQLVKKTDQQPASSASEKQDVPAGTAVQSTASTDYVAPREDQLKKGLISSKSVFYDMATHAPAIKAINHSEDEYSKKENILRLPDQKRTLDSIEDNITQIIREFDSSSSGIELDSRKKGIESIIADTLELATESMIKIAKDNLKSLSDDQRREYYSMISHYKLLESTYKRMWGEWAKIHSGSTKEVSADSIILLNEKNNESVNYQKKRLKNINKFLNSVRYLLANPTRDSRFMIKGLSEEDVNAFMLKQREECMGKPA